MGSFFAHFQVQALLAVRHRSRCPCTRSSCCIQAPFNGASTSQPTVVSQCNSASFEVSQIQLRSARYNWLRPWHCTVDGQAVIGGRRADCLQGAVYLLSLLKHKSHRCSSEFSEFFFDDNLQTYSNDTAKQNEKCSDITAEKKVKKSKVSYSLQHESSRDDVSFPHPLGVARKDSYIFGAQLLCER